MKIPIEVKKQKCKEYIDYYYNTNLTTYEICKKIEITFNGKPHQYIRKYMKENNHIDGIKRWFLMRDGKWDGYQEKEVYEEKYKQLWRKKRR